jgi:c-di-GMP-related signal transduction protein
LTKDTFIARQPIFDRATKVVGYELLHRSTNASKFEAEDPDQASAELIEGSVLLHRLATLTRGKRAFINVTRNLLVQDLLSILPKEEIVVELLETIQPEPRVIAAIRKLKEEGYLIALDDFEHNDSLTPLVELADIIKVDFLVTEGAERQRIMERCDRKDLVFLAEKVETRKDFEEALAMGYSLFQGFFFCEPETLHRTDLRKCKANYVRLLRELVREDLALDRITDVIKHEVSLASRLLRYLNSPIFGVREELTSIGQALVHLGEAPLRRWGMLVALSAMGDDKPSALMTACLVRARFCESIAAAAGLANRRLDLFLTGMFSAIDALLDRPMVDALSEMGLCDEIQQAILGDDSRLASVLRLALACEQGRFPEIGMRSLDLGISFEAVSETYSNALIWVDDFVENDPGLRAA